MVNGLLRVEEVALLLNCSVNTINSWYKFKSIEPDSPYAKMLPDFKKSGVRSMRLWRQEDIPKLIQFQTSLPIGRNGIMGKVTQKYVKKKKEE